MTALCYDPETASFVPEDELRRRQKSRRFDPEFAEKRKAWLREHHRAPLTKRAVDVLGKDGPALLNELRASNPAGCDDNHLRYILRAAARIPAHGRNLERRYKYISTCCNPSSAEAGSMTAEEIVESLQNLSDEEIRELTDDDWREYHAALFEAEKTPLQRLVDRIGKRQTEYCYNRLCKIYHERWPDDPEKAAENVRRIILNATNKKHPEKYISTVAMNERRDARLRCRKLDQRKGREARSA